jgi:hypothetical protein
VLRLQKPAAVIDSRFPPLDLLYAIKDGSSRANLVLYGSECVAEILSRSLGSSEGAMLNGGGTELVVRRGAFVPLRYVRFFPSSHYPLLDSGSDGAGYFSVMAGATGKPPTTDGFLFPPPFGEDALSWINKIAAYDHAVFFYGWPGDTERFETWPVPCYGRINNFTAGAPTRWIYDADYVGGDLGNLLLAAQTETRPEQKINRALVWGNPANQQAPAFLPALMVGEARLPSSDPNSADYSWERTEILKEDIAGVPGAAQGIANGVISQLSGVTMQFPDVTVRGNPLWFWGDKVQFQMNSIGSDLSIGLQNHVFRVQKVTHKLDFSGSDPTREFTTELNMRPVSGTGL